MLAASIFFSGVTFATTLPYGAIVGIQTLGMSSTDYALLVAIGAVVGAVASLALGALSDRLPDRRLLVLVSAFFGATGYGLIYLQRTPLAFAIAICLIVPFGTPIFSQCFSAARAYYGNRAPGRTSFMMSLLRSTVSVAWVIVPPVAGVVAAATSVFELYLASSLAYLACGAIFAAMIADPATRVATPVIEGPRARTASRPRVAPGIASGIAGILLVTLAMRLVGLAVPLSIVSTMGGTIADVGFNAGVTALVEIPFMLGWGYLAGRVSKEVIIVAAAVLYALYAVLVSRATTVIDVLWLQGLNAIASSALLSITISYMQDAIKGRLGLSTSLLDVVAVAATLLGAVLFGLLGAGGDYRTVLAVAAGVAALGALTMLAGNLGRVVRPRLPVPESP